MGSDGKGKSGEFLLKGAILEGRIVTEPWVYSRVSGGSRPTRTFLVGVPGALFEKRKRIVREG